ncbi:hypothetical protein MSIMFI_05536 [Mycobacterium simulans]|nr:hypothetical protein MSIMFI_05536 [Mycobacterium simulans]
MKPKTPQSASTNAILAASSGVVGLLAAGDRSIDAVSNQFSECTISGLARLERAGSAWSEDARLADT